MKFDGKTHFALLLILFAVGCSENGDPVGDESFGGDAIIADGRADGLALTSAEAAAVLRLVNEASFEELDDEVRLDRRAAAHIVVARADGPIADLEELDAIKWVGVRALGKLRTYVVANGLVVEPGDACLIISEYVEGKGYNNKAVEVFNCGIGPINLADTHLCMIRNDDRDCTRSTALGDHVLGPGDTLVLCRTRAGTFNDPMPWIVDACDVEVGSTAIFTGDDRLALIRDASGDSVSVHSGEVLDVLGRITYRPWDSPWNDVRLDRCRIEPNDGRTFYETVDWFITESWSRDAGRQLGLPPRMDRCP